MEEKKTSAIVRNLAKEREDRISWLAERQHQEHDAEAIFGDTTKLLESRRAADWAQQEYEDVFSNPRLRQWVLDEDERLFKAGDKRSFESRYRLLCETARRHLYSQRSENPDAEDRAIANALQLGSQEESVAAVKSLRGVPFATMAPELGNDEGIAGLVRDIQQGDADQAAAAVAKLRSVTPGSHDSELSDEDEAASTIEAMRRSREGQAQ